MSIFKKASAFLTALGIACSCAACGYNTINALTVDDMEIPAGVYIYYANSAYNQALSKLAEENPDLDTTDTSAVKACTLEGKDVLTWIQDEATDMCAEYVVIEKKFDELELTFDAETQTTMNTMKDYYWANSQKIFEKNGISESSFEKIVASSYKSELIFEHMYGIDGTEGVTEQEVYDYYKDNNIRCEYLALALKDGEGNLLKSDGKAEIMEMAEDYQARAEAALKSGGVEAVMEEMTAIREDYADYTASLTEQASEEVDSEGDGTATEAETEAETETAAEENETEETAAETAEGEVAPETYEATAAPDEPETEAASDAEDTSGEENAETEDTTEDTEETSEETGSEEKGEEDLDIIDDDAEEETTPYANENIIAVIDEANYDDPADITYNPSEKTYKQLLDIQPKDYGKVFIVEEDETYYLAVRYDIEDRMNEDDLWTESSRTNTVYTMYSDTFEDLLEEWTNTVTVIRNAAAYKRYDPFKFDFA